MAESERETTPKITIMAVGGAGCRVMREFLALGAADRFRLLALDSDADALQSSGLPESSLIQAGKLWRSGRGCGGDAMAGQMAAANERKVLGEALRGTGILLVIAGLGGGFASGGLPVVFGVAAKLRITSVLLCTLPFAMEGFQRRKLADSRITGDIMPVADAVIALPNDLLFSTLDAAVPLADAFRCSDENMARTLLAIALIFSGGNLFNADLAAFTGVLKRRHTLCSLGVGVAESGPDAPDRVVERMLESPLFGGSEALDTADAVVFSLLGGPELSLGDAKAVLELATRQVAPDGEKNVLLGAAVLPELTGRMQLTALTVRYLDEEVPSAGAGRRGRGAARGAEASPESSGGEQLALPNLTAEDKGIMENTVPVIIDGQDMDIPAYKRRGVVLDLGK